MQVEKRTKSGEGDCPLQSTSRSFLLLWSQPLVTLTPTFFTPIKLGPCLSLSGESLSVVPSLLHQRSMS